MTQLVKCAFKNKNSFWQRAKTFLRHRNLLKYAIYRYEWHHSPKYKTVRNFPVHLAIEPTNACNLSCVFCARHLVSYYKEFGFMDFDMYKKIIDEGVQKGLRSVKLIRGGEGLLHPRFADMIKYAREKGIVDIMFNTNAMLMTSEKAIEIINAKPDLVIFSVDSPEKESFERLRRGAIFEQVEENVKNFISLKNKIYPKMITRAHMVYTNETEHLIGRHIIRWQDIADEVTVTPPMNYCEKIHNKKFRCRTPFRRLEITWNGNVYACDADFDPHGKLFLGNIKEKSIYELWHSEKMKFLRDAFRKESPRDMDPCKYCPGM